MNTHTHIHTHNPHTHTHTHCRHLDLSTAISAAKQEKKAAHLYVVFSMYYTVTIKFLVAKIKKLIPNEMKQQEILEDFKKQ